MTFWSQFESTFNSDLAREDFIALILAELKQPFENHHDFKTKAKVKKFLTPFDDNLANASSYEFIKVREHNQSGTAADVDIITLDIPGFVYPSGGSETLGGSFGFAEIYHVATFRDAGNNDYRTQAMRIHCAWYVENGTLPAEGVRTNVIELARTPLNKAIVDPDKTTITFTTGGDMKIRIYHYATGDTLHKFRYKLI